LAGNGNVQRLGERALRNIAFTFAWQSTDGQEQRLGGRSAIEEQVTFDPQPVGKHYALLTFCRLERHMLWDVAYATDEEFPP
jgi:hypothetical protein